MIYKAILSIMVLLVAGVFIDVQAEVIMPNIGAREIQNPEDYHEYVPSGFATSADSPSQILNFDEPKYSFSLSTNANSDITKVTFRIQKANGSWTNRLLVERSDSFFGDGNSEVNNSVSQAYTFVDKIKVLELFYPLGMTVNVSAFDAVEDRFQVSYNTEYYTDSDSENYYKNQLYAAMGLNIITREEWGGPSDSAWEPDYHDINRIVVHHTATGVDLADPANTVRAIYYEHRDRCSNNIGRAPYNCDYSFTWSDIGYNYLIDPYGNIYEGRVGGNGTRAAHAPPNQRSIGISLLGNFTNQGPTVEAVNSAISLIAVLMNWNEMNADFNPGGNGTQDTGIYGHRNVNATACPGTHLYNSLPHIGFWANQYKYSNANLTSKSSSATQMLSNADILEDDEGNPMVIIDTTTIDSRILNKLRVRYGGAESVRESGNIMVVSVNENALHEYLTQVMLVAPSATVQPYYSYTSEVGENKNEKSEIPPTDELSENTESILGEADESIQYQPPTIPPEVLFGDEGSFDRAEQGAVFTSGRIAFSDKNSSGKAITNHSLIIGIISISLSALTILLFKDRISERFRKR
ncbi:MAG TPA: peptidoglycan recognition family protein [Candidatus Dojkabacteria bacterium]|jgi:hypothetical protein